MKAILYKEIAGFFSSWVAYVIIVAFLVVTGLFLWVFPESSILDYGYAALDSFFNLAPYIFMFLIPAVTMRSIAEERKDGTFELLVTRPLSDWEIVVGKFLASVVIVAVALLPTSVYYFSVYQLGIVKGNVDTGAVLGSYLGLLMLGSVFVSIGIFASSIGKNQVIAFVIAVLLCFLFFDGLDSLSQLLSLQDYSSNLVALGIKHHYQSISRGVLDTRDLVYFLSFIALFLLFTKTILGGRKW